MEQEKKSKEANKDHEECCPGHNHKKNPGALFIPGGVILGLGFDFLMDTMPAGLFIGLGLGFVAFAVSMFIKKS
ncbi:MAG: hypothetical protein ABIG60_03865 [Patescibacteria group bacterium]